MDDAATGSDGRTVTQHDGAHDVLDYPRLVDIGDPASGHDTGPRARSDISSLPDAEQLLSVVVHELRTPLAIMDGAADTITTLMERRDADPAQLRRMAEMIRRNSRLATRLVDRLGVAARVGKGTVQLVTTPIDLCDLVSDIVDDVVSFVLPERGVSLSIDNPVRVTVDQHAIAEIVFNLLANAAKYSHATTPIDVRVDLDDRTARVTVRDHGGGVAPDDTERIFEPYVQAGPNRGGVGLGLYVSRGLARAHDGELSVRAPADGGSEFVLELPLCPTTARTA